MKVIIYQSDDEYQNWRMCEADEKDFGQIELSQEIIDNYDRILEEYDEMQEFLENTYYSGLKRL